jgi:hypothetical protein
MPATPSLPWSHEERALLRQLWENGMGPAQIAKHLGRSKYSVTSETRTLHLGPRGGPPGLPEPPPGRVVLARAQPKPLPPGAHTLPPLPSEMHADE